MSYISVQGRIMVMATMLVAILALQGCGHKGPLMLPVPQAQTSGTPETNPQKSDLPAAGQNPPPQ
jgi:predicted small lipoprotein YifL